MNIAEENFLTTTDGIHDNDRMLSSLHVLTNLISLFQRL